MLEVNKIPCRESILDNNFTQIKKNIPNVFNIYQKYFKVSQRNLASSTPTCWAHPSLPLCCHLYRVSNESQIGCLAAAAAADAAQLGLPRAALLPVATCRFRLTLTKKLRFISISIMRNHFSSSTAAPPPPPSPLLRHMQQLPLILMPSPSLLL